MRFKVLNLGDFYVINLHSSTGRILSSCQVKSGLFDGFRVVLAGKALVRSVLSKKPASHKKWENKLNDFCSQLEKKEV